VKFELAMLAELGFGLDLETCAATGGTFDLIYVSPKSGGAVSRQAGDPWRDRLLRLPPFCAPAAAAERLVGSGSAGRFRLTGLFLLRHVLERAGRAIRRPRRFYQRGDQASGQCGDALKRPAAEAWPAQGCYRPLDRSCRRCSETLLAAARLGSRASAGPELGGFGVIRPGATLIGKVKPRMELQESVVLLSSSDAEKVAYDIYCGTADRTLRLALWPGAGLPAHLKRKD